MFDTVIRTNLIDNQSLDMLREYCERVDFYINESYGGISEELSERQISGITDSQLSEMGLPPVPNEVLRSHRYGDMAEEIKEISLNINKLCEEIILDKYNINTTYMQGGDFVRYSSGQSLPYHQDWTVSEWVIKHNLPTVHLSSVFYINDDYVGGELLFSSSKRSDYSHDIMSIKPVAGTVVFFDALQWHASAPVTNGFKFASTNFYTL